MDDSRRTSPVATDTGGGPQPDELRGGLFMVAGAAALAIHFAIIKYMTAELPEPVIALWRAIFALILFATPRLVKGNWRSLATNRPISHFWRAAFGFASFLIFVYALGMLPLGDTVALSFTTPFWSVLIGAVVFRDRFSWRFAVSLALGFGGVLLIAQPSSATGLSLGAILALTSAALGSLAMMMVKQLAGSEPPDRIAFYFALGGGVCAIPLAAFDWAWPAPADWPYLIALGVLFGIGQVCLSSAYAYGTFSRVAPLDLTRLPFSVIVGLLWLGEVPTPLALAGMALIALASIDLLLQGRKK